MIQTLIELLDGKKQRRRIPPKRRKIVFYRDGRRCRYCRTRLSYITFHVDHILPIYHHGNDYTFNLCASCPTCNMNKGANKFIKPKELSLLRRIYGVVLMIITLDIPKPSDFY